MSEQKRGRGRPKGSLNKKTILKNHLEANKNGAIDPNGLNSFDHTFANVNCSIDEDGANGANNEVVGNTKINHFDSSKNKNGANGAKNSCKKKEPRDPDHTYWCFTIFDDDIETAAELYADVLKHECDWYVFQLEESPITGRVHIQGTLKLKKKKRFSAMQKINPFIHWEGTRSVKASLLYCTKLKTSLGRVWLYGIDLPCIIPKDVQEFVPRTWQLEILKILDSPPHDRTIYWIYDHWGNQGKSMFAKWLQIRRDAFVASGKTADIAYAVSSQKHKPSIIIADFTRDKEEYISFSCLESLKNGHIFSGKYKSKSVVFDRPHLLVFANFPPDPSTMSLDRWCVKKLDNEQLVEIESTTLLSLYITYKKIQIAEKARIDELINDRNS